MSYRYRKTFTDSDVLDVVRKYPRMYTYAYKNMMKSRGHDCTTPQILASLKRLAKESVVEICGNDGSGYIWKLTNE